MFDRPEEFDPNRDGLARHLSLGHGIHNCVGDSLARLEMETALAALARRQPGLRLVRPEVVSYKPLTQFQSPRELRVTPLA
ncbi:hypothetical protein MPTA5024_27730 [Microbispora sp. ATCC PTA-5024]|nr:hypothetical protein MPTA5024_27730 [Microbispora sp. ATCC PTA-5024]